LYTFWRRTSPPPSMLAFDAGSREVCIARRDTTATPLQSLVLLNDPQFVEAARVLAESLLKRFPQDSGARIHAVVQTLLGRSPDAVETRVLEQLFTEQRNHYAGDPDAAAKLLAVGEMKADGALPPADFAALTMVASAIMGFDEFVTIR
jgi:hypothetical protein